MTFLHASALVGLLRRSDAAPADSGKLTVVETHMSWVFLTGDRAYKLKKPVRLPYLDFSTLEKREVACRSELKLNRRLAPTVYLAVEPLRLTPAGFRLGGAEGRIVDWLVVMRRLDEKKVLEHALASHTVTLATIVKLENTLLAFYRRAPPARLGNVRRMEEWHELLRTNRDVLLHFRLPRTAVLRVDRVQNAFLQKRPDLLLERQRTRQIVDGHGDLRPEHIFVNDTVSLIDCLEFNDRLRTIDPFEEAAFLAIECERHGARWIGEHMLRRLCSSLPQPPRPELISFYMCYRATLRARLAVAHLLEPNPRTPAKWHPLALVYLGIADRHARRLANLLKVRRGPSSHALRGDGR